MRKSVTRWGLIIVAKRKKNRRKEYAKVSRGFAIFGVFLATITTTLLSFISIELALLCFGVFTLAAIVYSEQRRRQFWEQAASFKFKNLQEAQDTLAKKIILNRKDIDVLKGEATKGALAQAGQAQKDQDKPVQKAPPLPLKLETQPLPRSPRASKPQQPSFDALVKDHSDRFDSVSDTVVRQLVQHAMHHKRVDIFVQPIMRLPQRQTRFYEMFARIRARPGQYLPAGRYMEIAEQDNLDSEIDNLLLIHCLQIIQSSAHIDRATPFFINIKNSTLKNGAFMKRLLGFVSKNRHLTKRLVFEIKQRDFDTMSKDFLEVIRGLGTLGCSFSLDHVENLKPDIADLQHFKIRYLKIDVRTFLDSQESKKRFAKIHRFKRTLEANGIGVIIEKIETEEQMRGLLDFDAHYGQGYLLGRPDLEGAFKHQHQHPAKHSGAQEGFG